MAVADSDAVLPQFVCCELQLSQSQSNKVFIPPPPSHLSSSCLSCWQELFTLLCCQGPLGICTLPTLAFSFPFTVERVLALLHLKLQLLIFLPSWSYLNRRHMLLHAGGLLKVTNSGRSLFTPFGIFWAQVSIVFLLRSLILLLTSVLQGIQVYCSFDPSSIVRF